MDVCFGVVDVFFEFRDVKTLDHVWANLITSPGWQADWAEKQGGATGSLYRILFRVERMPINYRFRFSIPI